MKQLADLVPGNRDREYMRYSESERQQVLYAYLFEKKSFREMDTDILHLNQHESVGWEKDTKGYQSKGILSYIGITAEHKGLFFNCDVEYALEQMDKLQSWQKIRNMLRELHGKVNG